MNIPKKVPLHCQEGFGLWACRCLRPSRLLQNLEAQSLNLGSRARSSSRPGSCWRSEPASTCPASHILRMGAFWVVLFRCYNKGGIRSHVWSLKKLWPRRLDRKISFRNLEFTCFGGSGAMEVDARPLFSAHAHPKSIVKHEKHAKHSFCS